MVGAPANSERNFIRVPSNPDMVNTIGFTFRNELSIGHEILTNSILVRHSKSRFDDTYNINIVSGYELKNFFLFKRAVKAPNVP